MERGLKQNINNNKNLKALDKLLKPQMNGELNIILDNYFDFLINYDGLILKNKEQVRIEFRTKYKI